MENRVWAHQHLLPFIQCRGSKLGGGNVHADEPGLGVDVAIQSEIPATCGVAPLTSCDPSFYVPGETGLMSRQSGTYKFDFEGGVLGPDAWEARTGGHPAIERSGGTISQFAYGYSYWEDKLSSYIDGVWSPALGFPSGGLTDFYSTAGTGTISIGGSSGGWTNITNQAIILHDGNMRVNGNVTITPESGGTLLVIIDGTLYIDPSVTQMHGYYIAEDVEIESRAVPGTDDQLVVEGGLVGWRSVTFGRDLGPNVDPLENAGRPAELFIFRPDIVYALRSYEELQTFDYFMREVAP